jgi:hypothetical protein
MTERGVAKMPASVIRPPRPTEKKTAAQKDIERIADDIVDLVEQTNGPVLFSEIDEKVLGFHAPNEPAYSNVVFDERGEAVIWDRMTEAGDEALHSVLIARRVALQVVDVRLYLLSGARMAEGTLLPYVLLPARAANIETPNCAMRVSPKMQRMMLKGAAEMGKKGYRPLVPGLVRSAADRFSF